MKPVKPLKIGFVFDDSLDSLDGVSQYVRRLGKWFSANGHSVSYLVGETKLQNWAGGKVYSLSRNVRVKFNGNYANIPLPAKSNHIKKVLKQEDFDVLHIQMPYSPFMAGKVINHANPKTAIVGTFHVAPTNSFVTIGTQILRLMCLGSLKHLDKIFSVSQTAADFAKKTFTLSTEISPNVIDMEEFTTSKQINNKKIKNIVFLGRLVERKGSMELLKAFNVLQKSHPDTKLLIAGAGHEERALKKYIKKNKLSQKVQLLGFISEETKPKLLSEADIACFPALGGESFGIVLIEAIAAGANVVLAGNNPGYSSVLGSLPECLFEPRDTEEFAKILAKFIEDKKLSTRIGDSQRKLLTAYDINIVGHQLIAAYQDIIAKKMKTGNN
jgi:phosphatidylinositol alpha-mannosyltransferase